MCYTAYQIKRNSKKDNKDKWTTNMIYRVELSRQLNRGSRYTKKKMWNRMRLRVWLDKHFTFKKYTEAAGKTENFVEIIVCLYSAKLERVQETFC